jgi:acetyl-CoA acetyltransferase
MKDVVVTAAVCTPIGAYCGSLREIPGLTLDRRCCSGVQSVWSGTMEIQTDNAEIVVCSGAESMSRAEFYIPGHYLRWGGGALGICMIVEKA